MAEEEGAGIEIWAYEPVSDTWVEVEVNAAGELVIVAA